MEEPQWHVLLGDEKVPKLKKSRTNDSESSVALLRIGVGMPACAEAFKERKTSKIPTSESSKTASTRELNRGSIVKSGCAALCKDRNDSVTALSKTGGIDSVWERLLNNDKVPELKRSNTSEVNSGHDKLERKIADSVWHEFCSGRKEATLLESETGSRKSSPLQPVKNSTEPKQANERDDRMLPKVAESH